MRHITPLVVLLFTLGTSSPVLAQGRGNGHAGGQGHSGPAVDVPKTHSQPAAPKTHTQPATPKAHTQTDTPKTHGPSATPKDHGKPTTTASTTAARTPTVTAATPTITTMTPTTQFAKNPKLEARLQNLLPAGTNVNTAAKGFKNWGQFVAAVHVSKNLHIPFADLKSRMTGANPLSLGQAIQATRSGTTTTTSTAVAPTTTTIVKRAEQEAAEDFRRARDDKH